MIEAECPKCMSDEFITTAVVQEDWLVDNKGNFLEDIDYVQVVTPPDPQNIWVCAKCHTEAIVTNI
jgi:hypothetical protein